MFEDCAQEITAGVGGVRVWLIDLDAVPDPAPVLALLAPDEQARARRFAYDVHRRRFVACRAALREVLGTEIGAAPQDVRFVYGPAGKPALEGPAAESPRFNVSHSDRLALIAVSRVGEVGVDLERIRPLSDMDRLVETVFSEAERTELSRLSDADHEAAFFHGWTRKEAYIKACGDKLRRLGEVDVSLAPADARLLRVEGQPAELARWRLHALAPAEGFLGALCVEAAPL